MLTQAQLPLNATVSFDYYPSQILGSGVVRAKVLAWMDADTAKFFGIDPIALHANVYPLLPPSTPNRYDGYPYVKLKLENGDVTAVGVPWIRDDTLVILTQTRARFTLENVTPDQITTALQALSANGLTAVNVEMLN